MKISATIITLNEETHITRCLESLQGVVDEIVVVDAGSRDKTCKIAEALGARVISRPWTNYSDQKNFAAAEASHEWILSVDADECLSSELREKLITLKNSNAEFAAYSFPRMAFYLGRWIRHSGWYPDFKVRLYQKGRASWEGPYVHETLAVTGKIAQMDADLLHFTCDSVSDHLDRLQHYTTLAAQSLRARGQRFSVFSLVLSPFSTFVSTYFLRSGFRDGVQGAILACFAAYYNFLKYAKLWELQRNERKAQPLQEQPKSRSTG